MGTIPGLPVKVNERKWKERHEKAVRIKSETSPKYKKYIRVREKKPKKSAINQRLVARRDWPSSEEKHRQNLNRESWRLEPRPRM